LQDFTISAWIQRSSVTIASHNLGGGQVFAFGGGGYGLEVDDDGHTYLVQHDVGSVGSSFRITDTNWHHLAATKSGSAVVFYLDGTSYPAAAYAAAFTFDTGAAVGARGDTLHNSFLGKLDEIAVYSRVLSDPEIEELVALGNAGERILPPRTLAQRDQR
jgi:hypothetical protein